VLGSALSLAYYLRVVAAVWLAAPDESPAPAPLVPAIAGGSQVADDEAGIRQRLVGSEQLEVVILAVVCAIATVALGIYPEPLLDVAKDAGAALTGLL